ncbi:MAG: OmpA family protein [Nitrospirales bacterium]
MCVSQNNSRLFLVIVLGMLVASGCSGQVKYGANSEGAGLGSDGEMTGAVDGVSYSTALNSDGTPMHGGTVNGVNPYLQSGHGASAASGEMNTEMAADKNSSIPGGRSDYGRQFGGVDGSGPNHGGVTGFGSGSANPNNPDPEAWANAYLREKRSTQGFYGDPSTAGSTDGSVSGLNQGGDSGIQINPETWAQAYVNENGGPSPEYVNPDTNIAQARRNPDSGHMGMKDTSADFVEIRDISGGFGGRVQDIYFAFDSWSISFEGAKYLEENAKWLHAHPEKALTIEGHCDQRGTQDYNLVLGKKRAEAAREYLVNLGVQPHRIKIVSYGKERPFCQKDNESCFQENRRNHMVVRMNQS